MKKQTYATFMNEVDNLISKLSNDELKKTILSLANKQGVSDRNEFLKSLRESIILTVDSDGYQAISDVSPEEFLQEIKELEQRILSGEFFDEEENYKAYEREEHSYWRRNGYYDEFDDEIDFSNENYVLEVVDLLEEAKKFFRRQDVETAHAAYEMLFNIFENPEYYEGEEYFIYGFSFEDAIESDVLKEHKTIYLRCKYLKCKNTNDFKGVYSALIKERDILLTDLIEIDRKKLLELDKFTNGFIEFLSNNARHDSHLADALFVKGGMEEVKQFAYANGGKHPPVFLYYYEYAKENQFTQSDLLNLILDGIKIIPEKYRIRAYLSLDLVKIAKEVNDKNNLLIGYSSAFFSNPSLRNLTYYIYFLLSENIASEIKRVKDYLNKKDIKKSTHLHSPFDEIHHHRDIYSLDTANIGLKALIIGKYILDDIEPLLDLINPEYFLGFSGDKNYVAIISALVLKSMSQASPVIVVDKLLDHYCLDITSDEYLKLKKLISDRSANYSLPQEFIHRALKTIESLAVNRVSHILRNKLRGGYDSACLLLVACAEIKQIIPLSGKDGNDLVRMIDTEYKRFSAFRKPLKDLTSQSKILVSV